MSDENPAPAPAAAPQVGEDASRALSQPATATLIQGLPLRRARPFWLPDTQGFLALAIIAVIATVVFMLLMKPPALDERAAGMLMTVVGVLIACLKDVYAFFFGSSAGSRSKDTTIANQGAALAVSTPPTPPAA